MSSKDDEYDYLFKGEDLLKKNRYFLFNIAMRKITSSSLSLVLT